MNKKTFENTANGLILRIKIVPNSSRNDIVFEQDFLKLKITAPPIENKANKELVAFLSKKMHCAKSKIQILKGELTKEKTIFIEGFDEETFLSCIS